MKWLADLLARPLGLMVALQLGWWAAVGGAAMEIYALGPLVIGVLLFIQTRALADRGMLLAVALLAVVGTVVDSLQSALGFINWSGPAPIVLAPLWITALWAHFATGLHAVSTLCRDRWWALALFGGVGGPFA